MFLFPSKSKNNTIPNREELSLLIEIQSASVKASIVNLKSNSQSKVVSSITRPISIHEHTSDTHFIKLMLQALTYTIQEISHQNNHFKNVHYILSSPWAVSHSKTMKIEYERDTEVTERTIRDLVNNDYKELIKVSDDKSNNLECIEQKIFDVKLNGYIVSSYNGKKTRKLEISFASTLAESHTMKKLHLVVTHFVQAKHFVHHSSSLLIFSALRLIKSDFLAVHIHGESTELVISSGGLCVYSSSFPQGFQTIMRKMENSMKKSSGTASSTIALLYGGKLDIAEEEKVRKIINPIMDEWTSEFTKLINDIKNNVHIPKLLYISSLENERMFSDVLKDYKIDSMSLDIMPFDTMSMYILVLENMLQ